MPDVNSDLHGNAPDESPVALIIIDMINDFNFRGGTALYKSALPVASNIRKLKNIASSYGIPTIYVNDNFGKWKSNFQTLIDHCNHDSDKGRSIVEILLPGEEDYFVLKPKHSGFFSTTLETLLKYLNAQTLILTGITSDICVLFTANDAYMRDFKLVVPQDCVGTFSEKEQSIALDMIERILKADIRPSSQIDLSQLL